MSTHGEPLPTPQGEKASPRGITWPRGQEASRDGRTARPGARTSSHMLCTQDSQVSRQPSPEVRVQETAFFPDFSTARDARYGWSMM